MADNFVEFAKGQMGAVERLLKGLPGISGYIDKDLRRDADKRVRDAVASSLDQSKAAITAVQKLRTAHDVDLLYAWGVSPTEAVIPIAESNKIPSQLRSPPVQFPPFPYTYLPGRHHLRKWFQPVHGFQFHSF